MGGLRGGDWRPQEANLLVRRFQPPGASRGAICGDHALVLHRSIHMAHATAPFPPTHEGLPAALTLLLCPADSSHAQQSQNPGYPAKTGFCGPNGNCGHRDKRPHPDKARSPLYVSALLGLSSQTCSTPGPPFVPTNGHLEAAWMSPPWVPFRSRASRGVCSSTPKTTPGSFRGCPAFQRTKNYYRPTNIDAKPPV